MKTWLSKDTDFMGSHRKFVFLLQIPESYSLGNILEAFTVATLRRTKNKTVISFSEKSNSVLTLPLGTHYNSCRLKNSYRTKIGAFAVDAANPFTYESEPRMYFQEA